MAGHETGLRDGIKILDDIWCYYGALVILGRKSSASDCIEIIVLPYKNMLL